MRVLLQHAQKSRLIIRKVLLQHAQVQTGEAQHQGGSALASFVQKNEAQHQEGSTAACPGTDR